MFNSSLIKRCHPHREGTAVSILAQLEQHHDRADRRRSPRRTLTLEAAATPPSVPAARVIIHDLSLTGLLIETSASLTVGERLRVQFPEAGTIEARLVWASGRLFGCEFQKPISKATLSAALLRSPALQSETSNLVVDGLAELVALRSTVKQLTAKIDALTEHHEDRFRASASTAPLMVDDDDVAENEADTRLSFSMRLRIIVALSLTSWALILWALGVL